MKKPRTDHISNIMRKHRGIFNKNFIIFFSNSGQTGNPPEFEFDKFLKIIFWRQCKCNIYIVTTSALDFKQFYILYKFYPIPYSAQTFNCSIQT